MIFGFYFRFYNLTHSMYLSAFLAYLARFIFWLRFCLKRLTLKHESITIDSDEAISILQRTSPEPQRTPDYSMSPTDEDVDLSIIVPVYNHLNALKRCIDSLIEQKTQYSYELILVDDGSTDGAQTFIEEYGRHRFVHIFHQKNGGIAAARNMGLCHAVGRYLMFIDCDDYVHDDLVESLLTKVEQEDADIAMCAHNLVKVREGRILSRLPNIYPPLNLLGYKNGDEIMNYAGLPWGKVYKRNLFENVRFFPGYWYEDTIIHSLIFTRCRKFTYVPEVKYEYQWYEGNFSHTQGGKSQVKSVDRYWLLKAILEHFDEMGLQTNTMFYTMLLKHVSAYYYPTVSSLPADVVQAMFVAGRELVLRYKPEEKVNLPYMLRLTEKALINNDIALWKLCSVNQ